MREEKPSSDDSEMRDNSFSQPSSNNESNLKMKESKHRVKKPVLRF